MGHRQSRPETLIVLGNLLKELDAELHRIGKINTEEDRERVVPELTVWMWLEKAKAVAALSEPKE